MPFSSLRLAPSVCCPPSKCGIVNYNILYAVAIFLLRHSYFVPLAASPGPRRLPVSSAFSLVMMECHHCRHRLGADSVISGTSIVVAGTGVFQPRRRSSGLLAAVTQCTPAPFHAHAKSAMAIAMVIWCVASSQHLLNIVSIKNPPPRHSIRHRRFIWNSWHHATVNTVPSPFYHYSIHHHYLPN